MVAGRWMTRGVMKDRNPRVAKVLAGSGVSAPALTDPYIGSLDPSTSAMNQTVPSARGDAV